MPLSAKARIEVYLPDLPRPAYQDLLHAFESDFTCTFGGCSTIHGLEGSYLSRAGIPIRDRVNLIYCDLPFDLNANYRVLEKYADWLKDAAFNSLDEEAILIGVYAVHHAE